MADSGPSDRSSYVCPDCGATIMRGVNHNRYCPRRLHLLRAHGRRQHVGALHPDCPACQKFGFPDLREVSS